MNISDIRANNEDDVRRYLAERPVISGEAYGMIALLFDGDGIEIVDRLVRELGVQVTGPNHI